MGMKADSVEPSWQRHSSARRPGAPNTERTRVIEAVAAVTVVVVETKKTIHARFGWRQQCCWAEADRLGDDRR